MPNLALFDFDGTITVADTFTPFIRYAVSPRRLQIGGVALSPLIFGYKLGIVPASLVRTSIVRVGFRGRKVAEINQLGEDYAREHLPALVRPDALARIHWHQARGDTVALVSASLSPYLAPWCRQLGIDLLCSELAAKDGVLTGAYQTRDCIGEEKARKIRAAYTLAAYPTVYAYGDTRDDEAMLGLAHKRYLRWRDVSATTQYRTQNGRFDHPDNAQRLSEIALEDRRLAALVAAQG